MVIFRTLLVNDIRLFLKDWKALLLLLVMPILFVAFFTYTLAPLLTKNSFIEPFAIALVDEEDSVETRMFLKQLEQLEIFGDIIKMDLEEAKESMQEKDIAAAVVIPQGFTGKVAKGENIPVTVIGNPSMKVQADITASVAQSAATLISAGQSAINTIYHFGVKAGIQKNELEEDFNLSVMDFFLGALSRHEIFTEPEREEGFDVSAAEYYTAAIIAIFLMFAGMPAVKLMVFERNSGLMERLSVSPCKPWKIIVSKFTISFLLSSIQFAVIVFLTARFFNAYWGAPVRDILLVFAASILAVASWSVLVASIASTPAAADIIGNLGILLMAVAGGSIYPLPVMPEFVRNISKITINRWVMEGFMTVFSANPALKVSNAVLPLLGIGFGMLIMATAALKLNGFKK